MLELLLAVVIVLDDLSDSARVSSEIPFLHLVDCNVEAGAEEDCYTDLRLRVSLK